MPIMASMSGFSRISYEYRMKQESFTLPLLPGCRRRVRDRIQGDQQDARMLTATVGGELSGRPFFVPRMPLTLPMPSYAGLCGWEIRDAGLSRVIPKTGPMHALLRSVMAGVSGRNPVWSGFWLRMPDPGAPGLGWPRAGLIGSSGSGHEWNSRGSPQTRWHRSRFRAIHH